MIDRSNRRIENEPCGDARTITFDNCSFRPSFLGPPLHAIDDCQFVVAGHVGRVESGDKSYETWAEGSHLKEYTYAKTGGTGKYEGLAGGGTYMYEGLTDKLFGGRYKGRLVLP
jgi:hypothetical protein